MFWIGLGAAIASIIGAAVWWAGSRNAHSTSVESLARVAPKLTTQLTFSSPGKYTMYYESAGEMTVDLDGKEQRRKIVGSANPAKFKPELADADGKSLRIERRANDITYDTGGFKGVSVRSFTIDDPGRYELTITPLKAENDSFAIAIGKGTISEPTLAAPLGLLLAGLALGAALMFLGRRRTAPHAAGAATAGPGTAGPGWPSGSMPGMSPGMPPGVPPGGPSASPPWGAPPSGPWGQPPTAPGAPPTAPATWNPPAPPAPRTAATWPTANDVPPPAAPVVDTWASSADGSWPSVAAAPTPAPSPTIDFGASSPTPAPPPAPGALQPSDRPEVTPLDPPAEIP